MLFNSWVFIALLLTCLVAYYGLAPLTGKVEQVQVATLVVASFIFYSFANPPLAILLAVSIAINALVSYYLLTWDDDRAEAKRRLLQVGVSANLLLLAWFKYAALLAEAILPSSLEEGVVPGLRDIPLPVGISFYTFQGISLLVDIARRDEVARRVLTRDLEKGLGQFIAHVALYVSFFAQLVAGPIVKAHEFVDQITTKFIRDVNWAAAGRALVLGYFLKMVVADNLKEHTLLLSVGDFEGTSKFALLVLIWGYSAQIFADFAGYSLIAIGLGRLFGYRLPINFNFPYISLSITEFWRRWHISLSSWLREYLYIALGGNRRGTGRTYFNLMMVMVFGGLWHGAEWNYAVWGFAHGLFLVVERLIYNGQPPAPKTVITHVLRLSYTFFSVAMLWLLFISPDFGRSMDYYRELVTAPLFTGSQPLLSNQTLFSIAVFSVPVLLYHVWGASPKLRRAVHGAQRASWEVPAAEAAIVGAMLFFVISNSGTPGEFIYFQF